MDLKLKMLSFYIKFQPESFTNHIQRAFVFHRCVLILKKSKIHEQYITEGNS